MCQESPLTLESSCASQSQRQYVSLMEDVAELYLGVERIAEVIQVGFVSQ